MFRAGRSLFAIWILVAWSTLSWGAPSSGHCLRDRLQVMYELDPATARNLSATINAEVKTISEFIQDQPDISISREKLEKLVPKALVPYYDRSTGWLHYKNPRPFVLSLENGDERMTTLRINWSNIDYQTNIGDFSSKHFAQMVGVLKKDPELKLIVTVSEKKEGKADALKTLRGLLLRVPADIRKRIEVVTHKQPSDFWAQDGSKPVKGEKPSVILPAQSFDSGARFPKALSRTGVVQARKSILDFDGGNVIVGARHIFVGSELVTNTAERFRISRSNALEVIAEEFGKPVIEVGTQYENEQIGQIDFHIDLTMGVARNHKTGKEVILLDSPDLALKLLLDAGEIEKASKKEVGTIYDMLDSHPVPKLDQALHQRKLQLAELKKTLEAQGYEVVEVPGLNIPREDDPDAATYLGFTNSIFSGKSAITSRTGIASWDRYVQKLFEGMGYEVQQLSIAKDSFCLHGGIRCLSETYREALGP